MASVLELYTVSGTVLGGASGGGVELELATGLPGGPAGSAFGFGIPRPTVTAGTLTPFSYVPFPFRLDWLRQASVAGSGFTLRLLKNGVVVWGAAITETVEDFALAPAVSYATGDVLALQYADLLDVPEMQTGTFVGVRL